MVKRQSPLEALVSLLFKEFLREVCPRKSVLETELRAYSSFREKRATKNRELFKVKGFLVL